jgi:peroxiredoxin
MARTASTMLPLGTTAPAFSLPDTKGNTISLESFEGSPALLVIFMCNHCPYVKHVAPELVRLYRDYANRGVAMVGISSNDPEAYPDDAPPLMLEEAKLQGYQFPYLFDAEQSAAKAYRAACTPDFFLFDAQRQLVYRGQLDDSRPKNDQPLNGKHLRQALDSVLAGHAITTPQLPSIGCNIKWKPGNEPDYYAS